MLLAGGCAARILEGGPDVAQKAWRFGDSGTCALMKKGGRMCGELAGGEPADLTMMMGMPSSWQMALREVSMEGRWEETERQNTSMRTVT